MQLLCNLDMAVVEFLRQWMGLECFILLLLGSSGGGQPACSLCCAPAADVVAAQIVWQPSPPAPAAVHRRPLQAITPVASFFSW